MFLFKLSYHYIQELEHLQGNQGINAWLYHLLQKVLQDDCISIGDISQADTLGLNNYFLKLLNRSIILGKPEVVLSDRNACLLTSIGLFHAHGH